MAFDRSQLQVLDFAPWRYTTQPTYDGMTELTPGVKQALDGVFILMSDELVTMLRTTMTAAEKTEVAPWVNRYTEAQCATWHVPVWGGQSSAVYWRIPASVWASPTDPVPLKVKTYFRNLFREDA